MSEESLHHLFVILPKRHLNIDRWLMSHREIVNWDKVWNNWPQYVLTLDILNNWIW